MNKPKLGRPRLGTERKLPNDYPRLVLRPPPNSQDIIDAMKALAQKENKTIGEVWIEAAKLRLKRRASNQG